MPANARRAQRVWAASIVLAITSSSCAWTGEPRFQRLPDAAVPDAAPPIAPDGGGPPDAAPAVDATGA